MTLNTLLTPSKKKTDTEFLCPTFDHPSYLNPGFLFFFLLEGVGWKERKRTSMQFWCMIDRDGRGLPLGFDRSYRRVPVAKRGVYVRSVSIMGMRACIPVSRVGRSYPAGDSKFGLTP